MYTSDLHCFVRNFLKGFAVATSGLALLAALPAAWRSRHKVLPSLLHPDHARNGVVFGLYVALYNTALSVLGGTSGRRRARAAPAAGVIAGLALTVASKRVKYNASSFMFVRAMEVAGCLLAETCSKNPFASSLAGFADVVMMAVSSMQVLWCWQYDRQSLDPKYAKFLDIHGGKPKPEFDAYCAVGRGAAPLNAETVNSMREALQLPPLASGAPVTFYGLLHPREDSTLVFLGRFFVREAKQAVKLYLPLYGVTALAFRNQKLLKRPLPEVQKLVFSTVRSTAFLATYCTAAWGIMALQYAVSRSHPATSHDWRQNLPGVAAGAALLVEKKDRRGELATYVFMHAVHASLMRLRRWLRTSGRLGPALWAMRSGSADVAVFCLCSAFLAQTYVASEWAIRPIVVLVMRRFLDGRSKRHLSLVAPLTARWSATPSKTDEAPPERPNGSAAPRRSSGR
mmetsp:Transcript_27358/g.66071  ORF Transcript_27358/g.66071 Transcript_27358/m.66071 type:complete len:456 (-) Transcript_27358:29-1396(-)